jgi:hypothetical protein
MLLAIPNSNSSPDGKADLLIPKRDYTNSCADYDYDYDHDYDYGRENRAGTRTRTRAGYCLFCMEEGLDHDVEYERRVKYRRRYGNARSNNSNRNAMIGVRGEIEVEVEAEAEAEEGGVVSTIPDVAADCLVALFFITVLIIVLIGTSNHGMQGRK